MSFKFIKVHFLVSELYIYQNARCNDKKDSSFCLFFNEYLKYLENFTEIKNYL